MHFPTMRRFANILVMLFMHMASFCIAFLLLVLISKFDVSGSELISCKTPTGKNGICTNLLQCPKTFMEHHSEPGLAHYMQNYQCGGHKDNICCPISKNKHNLIPSEEICGISKTSPKDRIVGGHPAKLGAWPWIVALGYNEMKNKPYFICGGSLITKRHVITAAHCIYRMENKLYMVRIADLDLETDGDGANPVERKIKYTKLHEEYNEETIENDIAIIGLDHDVKFTDMVRPICLPINPWIRYLPLVNKMLYTAGWGHVYSGGPHSSELRQVQLPVVPNLYCRIANSNLGSVIDKRVICAGWREGGKDACQGDSGGPLIYIKKNRKYLMGIVSFGDGCALPRKPGVYTRVTEYLDWIENNIY